MWQAGGTSVGRGTRSVLSNLSRSFRQSPSAGGNAALRHFGHALSPLHRATRGVAVVFRRQGASSSAKKRDAVSKDTGCANCPL
eukprot:358113-Chlamydomonas_euryale.AAC.5